MISIKNERGSWRTCKATYRITLVRHKVVDTESTYPMSLAMSCLFLGTSGMWRQLLHHYHRTKGSLLGNSSEANCLGERTKVVKLGSLSTLEVLIEMNKGISILYCGWLRSQLLWFLKNENVLAGLGMFIKDAHIFLWGDYHDQPSSHFGIVERVTGLRSHFNFNLFLKWLG